MQAIITFLTTAMLVTFVAGLMGCGAAQVALEQKRQADPGDINVAKTIAYDRDQVAAYNRIFVISRETEGSQLGMSGYSGTAATGGASAAIFSGRIALELAKEGYDVLEQDDLERVSSDEQNQTDTLQTIVALASKVEADVIVTTIAQQASVDKVGAFGVGAGMETGIISTSIKFVDATTNRTIAIIASDYPEPRTASEVVEGLRPSILDVLGRPIPKPQEKSKSHPKISNSKTQPSR